MDKTAMLVLAAVVSVSAIPAAYAHDSDIRSDWRHIHRDRARLHADEARLRDERRELTGAERREQWALRHGRFWQAWRAERLERREAADVRALERKVYRDRVDLARDRADLRRDVLEKVNKAIDEVAREKGLDLVLQDPAFASDALDITGEVLKKLATYPADAADGAAGAGDKKKKKK